MHVGAVYELTRDVENPLSDKRCRDTWTREATIPAGSRFVLRAYSREGTWLRDNDGELPFYVQVYRVQGRAWVHDQVSSESLRVDLTARYRIDKREQALWQALCAAMREVPEAEWRLKDKRASLYVRGVSEYASAPDHVVQYLWDTRPDFRAGFEALVREIEVAQEAEYEAQEAREQAAIAERAAAAAAEQAAKGKP